jgi:hypothetical protein
MTGLWGVGRYDGADGPVDWEISHDEIQRDIAGATRRLEDLGVGGGDRVLFCSCLAEAGSFWPFLVAAMVRGAQLSCADGTRADAMRVAMFTRDLEYRAVLGISTEVLDGLDDLGLDYAATLGSVPVIGARPGAYERLVDAELSPHRFVLVGPAVAVGTEPGGPAALDPDEWELATDADGRVTVTSMRPRATTFTATPTRVRGTVRDGSLVPDDPEEHRWARAH